MIDSHRPLNNLGNEEMVELLSKYFSLRGQFLAQVIRADLQMMSRSNNQRNSNGYSNGNSHYNLATPNGHAQNATLPNNNGYSNGNGHHNLATPNGHAQNATLPNNNGYSNGNSHHNLAAPNGHGYAQNATLPNNNGYSNSNSHHNLAAPNGHGYAQNATLPNNNGYSNGNSHGYAQNATLPNNNGYSNGNSNPVHQPTNLPQPVAQSQIQPVTQTSQNVEDILVDLVVQQTGYPKETIGLELKLLDDLNLDSIKAGEVVAAAAKDCGVAGQLDPSTLANASLQEAAQIIRGIMSAGTPAQPSMSVEPAKVEPQTQENANWVRNFAVEYVAEGR